MIITMFRKTNFVIVSTTTDSMGKAVKLAEKIVKSRLAACVQSAPIRSIYRWKGKVEKANEYLLISKTRVSLADRLVSFIRKNHSYEVPEIVITPVTGGLKEYLSWIDKETGK